MHVTRGSTPDLSCNCYCKYLTLDMYLYPRDGRFLTAFRKAFPKGFDNKSDGRFARTQRHLIQSVWAFLKLLTATKRPKSHKVREICLA